MNCLITVENFAQQLKMLGLDSVSSRTFKVVA